MSRQCRSWFLSLWWRDHAWLQSLAVRGGEVAQHHSNSAEIRILLGLFQPTEPKLLAEDRLGDLADGVVVASSSAALLHGVGDLGGGGPS